MIAPREKSSLLHNLLLASVLIAAQWGALVHAFEHDIGAPQSQVCTTCVAASQLGFACIDTSAPMESMPPYLVQHADFVKDFQSTHALVARQRGPPTPL